MVIKILGTVKLTLDDLAERVYTSSKDLIHIDNDYAISQNLNERYAKYPHLIEIVEQAQTEQKEVKEVEVAKEAKSKTKKKG